MNGVCSKDSINLLKYNYRNNTNIYEERNILRKLIYIKIDQL